VIPVSFSLIIGINLGTHFPEYTTVYLLLFVLSLLFLSFNLKRAQPARVFPFFAVVCAGALSMTPWMAPKYGPDHVVHYLDTGYWRVRGAVAEQPVVGMGRTRTVVKLHSLSREGATNVVNGRIRLTVMGDVNLSPGDRLIFPSKIRPFRNFKNPGGFDYRRYMAFKGIHGSAWVKAEKLQRDGNTSRNHLSQRVSNFRKNLARLIDRAGNGGEKQEKSVLKALVLGDRTGIDSELRGRFNRAGAGHLLAISGLHVGIVATASFAFFRWFFSSLPFLVWRGWCRQWAAVATLGPVLAYGVLAGMSPSTQRAEIMVCVCMVALVWGRLQDMFNTLAVAALIILLVFPPAIFTISFQLSFAAVLVIVYGMGKIGIAREPEVSIKRNALQRIKAFALLSVFALAGTAPLALFYFNQTSVIGIAANLLLIPIVGFFVVPLGLFSALLSVVLKPASIWGFSLCLDGIRLALAVIDFFASFPFGSIMTVTPSVLEIFIYYAVGWCLFNLHSQRFAIWMMAAALVLAVGDGLFWTTKRFWHRDLVVTAIDVGQGGSTLMELPGGKVILYDGGGFSDNRFFDMGKRVVAPFLWKKKIATVDILILSHANADHLNGLIYIAEQFNVRELWTNGDINTTKGYRELMSVCEKKGLSVRRIDTGFGQQYMGPVTLDLLHPPPGYFNTAGANVQEKRNDGSLVVKVMMGEHSFLLTGDIEKQAEIQMIERAGICLSGTVLFAPHHGSKSSSSTGFLSKVNPEIVVISAGEGNRFGFPHDEVIDRYHRAGARIFSTATQGAIAMRTDGERIHVRTAVEGIDEEQYR
jgi:competence protein ComEC